MRALMILGIFAILVLLVTPSDSEGAADGGAEMMTMNSRDEDLTVERNAKRNRSKKPCCPCSGRKRGCRMMTMNSRDEDLTVERNAKRNRSKKPCCPCSGRKRGCRYCRGSCAIGRSFRGEADAFE